VTSCPDFPIIKYADDTILVMPACEVQLEVVESILETFATATGLKVNQHKSVMAPINVSQEKKCKLLQHYCDARRDPSPLHI
jgi:hypothetical protein